MRSHLALLILGLAVGAASSSLGQTIPPSSSGNSTSAGATPARNSNAPGSLSGSISGINATTGQTTIEGQLVDVFDAAQQFSTGSAAGAAPTGLPSVGLSNDTSTHLGDSAGTYNHPGIAPGSSDTGASIGRSAGGNAMNSGNRGTGSIAGTGGMAGSSVGGTNSGAAAPNPNSNSAANARAPGSAGTNAASSSLAGAQGSPLPASQSEIRSQLTSGIPAAVYVNGQSFVLACDPRQLAAYAGQSVRISGRIASNNVLVPSKLEVRAPSGAYRSVALALPTNTHTGTANER